MSVIFDKMTVVLEDYGKLIDRAGEEKVSREKLYNLIALFYLARLLALIVILLMPEYEEVEETINDIENPPPPILH